MLRRVRTPWRHPDPAPIRRFPPDDGRETPRDPPVVARPRGAYSAWPNALISSASFSDSSLGTSPLDCLTSWT